MRYILTARRIDREGIQPVHYASKQGTLCYLQKNVRLYKSLTAAARGREAFAAQMPLFAFTIEQVPSGPKGFLRASPVSDEALQSV